MRRKVYWLAGVGLVLVAFGIVWGVSSREKRTPATAERPPAPEFALMDLGGKTVRLSDFKGQVRIVDFWATWCPPCRAEIPHFQALYEKYRQQGMTVIGISLDETGAQDVRSFAESVGMTYPTLMGDAPTALAYDGVPSIPTTFVIDRKGRVYRKYVGYQERAVFEKDIQELLKEG